MESTIFYKKAQLIRMLCLQAITKAKSGHATSCLSAADITTVLFDKYFTYDTTEPHARTNDRFILSKGHAAPLLYALFHLYGLVTREQLSTLRTLQSPLQGHPTPELPFVDVATGSLGQGLSAGAGISYAMLHDEEIIVKPRVYVLIGDGESAEGQIWEAANFAAYYHLYNLVAIVDINRLGQSQETMFDHNIAAYQKRWEAFGWQVHSIDGHDYDAIDTSFESSIHATDKPQVILANTIKGKGVSFLENKNGWHGKALTDEELENALRELGEIDDTLSFTQRKPHLTLSPLSSDNHQSNPRVSYEKGSLVATREAYGEALVELIENNSCVYSLDGDTKNSTFSELVYKKHPKKFIECFIAEQNMVGVAMGLSAMGITSFVSTFAAFLTRAHDQIRMAAISHANIKFVGSHAGVSIGEDGPSQMGLENIALFGAIPGCIIMQPADAITLQKILPLVSQHKGLAYLQTLRPKVPVLYNHEDTFSIGGAHVLRSSSNDICTIVATGITVHEAIKAYDILIKENISIRIIDCYSLVPINSEVLRQAIKETKIPLIISVEDHFVHGGLGDLICDALAKEHPEIRKMAVREISHSGKPEELLALAGIDASHIVQEVKLLL